MEHLSPTYPDKEHPLTSQFIQMVAEGKTPFEATYALIGPLLPRDKATKQCSLWELDDEVQIRIAQAKRKKAETYQGIREKVIAKSVAMAVHDPRNYYTPTGIKMPNDWTSEEAAAVKKIKITETTDPFGTVKRTFDLEFYDSLKAVKQLCELFPEIVAQTIEVSSLKSYDEMSDDELEIIHQKLLG
jgi:hypothetical protein